MFNVCYIDNNGAKGMAVYQAALNSGYIEPIDFPTAEDAWDFIEKIMQEENHPRLMWIKETVCKSSTT